MKNLQPFMRLASDGTYEVVVPLTGHISPLVLPYAFLSKKEGLFWINSRKGSKRIEQARTHPELEY
jgi:hypothetical protein